LIGQKRSTRTVGLGFDGNTHQILAPFSLLFLCFSLLFSFSLYTFALYLVALVVLQLYELEADVAFLLAIWALLVVFARMLVLSILVLSCGHDHTFLAVFVSACPPQVEPLDELGPEQDFFLSEELYLAGAHCRLLLAAIWAHIMRIIEVVADALLAKDCLAILASARA